MTKPRILHVGLCVHPAPMNAMQQAFVDNSSAYAEISTGHPQLNTEIIRVADEFKPDLVFFQIQAPGIVSPAICLALKRMGIFTMNWTGDVRDCVPQWMYDFGADVTLFSNMRDVKTMSAEGFAADYLEIGFNENIYTHRGEAKNIEPVVFFGNSYGPQMFPQSEYRIKMCTFLKAIFGGRFGIYGTGWNISSGNLNHSQPEEAAAYRGAKIAINCSHYNIEDYSSDRLLRILGTGTPICLAQYYEGCEKHFEDGVHLRFWKSIEELKELIIYYLEPSHEQERASIATQGMGLAREMFTFNHMAVNAINLYDKWRKKS